MIHELTNQQEVGDLVPGYHQMNSIFSSKYKHLSTRSVKALDINTDNARLSFELLSTIPFTEAFYPQGLK
ncbi:hypothetical protein AAZX31_11G048200 [Glycine max]